MKQFLTQQKGDYRQTKNMFKRQLEEDTSMSSAQRRQILEERKKELLLQQRMNQEEYLHQLKEKADKRMLEFKQKVLQDRQGFEKDLLQLVRLMEVWPSLC